MKQHQRKATRIMPFAQFFGLAPRAESQEDDDLDEDRKQRDGESDEDYASRMDALDKDNEGQDGDENVDPGAEDPEGQDDDDEDANPDADDRAEDDEDDDERKDKPADAKKAARKAERERCAAIVAHGIKTKQTILACSFAFDTNLSASQAKSALNAARKDAAASSPHHPSLNERMASVQTPNPGANGGKGSGNAAKTLADRIVAVGERVRQK